MDPRLLMAEGAPDPAGGSGRSIPVALFHRVPPRVPSP